MDGPKNSPMPIIELDSAPGLPHAQKDDDQATRIGARPSGERELFVYLMARRQDPGDSCGDGGANGCGKPVSHALTNRVSAGLDGLEVLLDADTARTIADKKRVVQNQYRPERAYAVQDSLVRRTDDRLDDVGGGLSLGRAGNQFDGVERIDPMEYVSCPVGYPPPSVAI
jgi:hypothetical protein